MPRELTEPRLGRISIAGSNSKQCVRSVTGALTNFKTDSDDEDQDPRAKIPLRKSPFLNRYSNTKEVPFTPPRKRIAGNGYKSKKASRIDKSPSFRDLSDDGISCSADDASVRDSGFWESHSVETGAPSHSSPWSTQQRQASSPCSDYDGSVGKADWESLMDTNSPNKCRFEALCNGSPTDIQVTAPQNLHGGNLPSFIKLGPGENISVRNAANDEDEARTVYGSLFEQLDPWSTVGFILGLPEIMASENHSRSNSLCNSQPEKSDFETTEATEPRIDELREDYDEEFNSLFDGSGKMSSPMRQLMEMDVVEDTIPTFSARELTNPDLPAPALVEAIAVGGREELADDDIPELLLKPLEIFERHPVELLFARSDDGDDSPMSWTSPKYVPQCFKAPDHQQDRDELVEDHIRGRSETGTGIDCDNGRNFYVPSLREVDGMFVGPTLFDDFGDSEEE
ncbi:hypothetical protein M413DRAFT_351181 [Hebeloma cylindrosporum]|uniref:Uncharacterized protein n=1 Tax=Hebeloma cylindrosporum TaxID=76867 RepID=A0A0C3BV42_HEBCY|nr:hypothetical protein M413DRAFT_351181 [Hebeloma cylindrosporum h7]